MKRLVLALTALVCLLAASTWYLTTRSSGSGRQASDLRQVDARAAFAPATPIPTAVQSRQPTSDRADPQKIFEAIEATNVPINFWGKVADQDGGPLNGVTVHYDYSIEHGNLLGVAWSDQEHRMGDAITDADGLFSIQGLKGHNLTILSLEKRGYQFRGKGDMIYDFYGSTASGRFVPEQRRPIVFTMVQKAQMEPLVHVKGKLRLRGEGVPERWNLWEGEPDPNGELAVTLRREPALLERPGQAATWSADLQIVGGGILIASLDEDVRRAPEDGYLSTIAYPQTEQKRGVPYWSFYVKTVDGRFGRIQVELDAYSQGATSPCYITGDMNPRPASRNLEPTEK